MEDKPTRDLYGDLCWKYAKFSPFLQIQDRRSACLLSPGVVYVQQVEVPENDRQTDTPLPIIDSAGRSLALRLPLEVARSVLRLL